MRAQNRHFKALTVLLVASFWSIDALGQSAATYMDYARFSMKLSPEICARYNQGRTLNRPLPKTTQGPQLKQKLFYYHLNTFDPKRGTVFVHMGGPGALLAPTTGAEDYDFLKQDFNLVTHHSRGSGCSAEPLTDAADASITVESEVKDIEAIRQSLGLKHWDAFLGLSAGTAVGRFYAAHFPGKVKNLILSGISGSEASGENKKKIKEYAARLWGRFVEKNRDNIFRRHSPEQIERMKTNLEKLFAATDESVNTFFRQAFFYPKYRSLIPVHRSSNPVLQILPLWLNYYGETDLDEALVEFVRSESAGGGTDLAESTDLFTPAIQGFLNSFFGDAENDARDPFATADLRMAWRVQANLDLSTSRVGRTCFATPILILQGGADMATPAKHAFQILNEPNCYSGSVTLALDRQAGHVGMRSPECREQLIRSFLSTGTSEVSPTCSQAGVEVNSRPAAPAKIRKNE